VESTTRERHRLEQLRRWTADPALALRSRRHLLYEVAGWLLIFLGTFIALAWNPSPLITVPLGALGGILGGVGFLTGAQLRRRPQFAPYIDTARIDQRLSVLASKPESER
jgi:hypothetical protein